MNTYVPAALGQPKRSLIVSPPTSEEVYNVVDEGERIADFLIKALPWPVARSVYVSLRNYYALMDDGTLEALDIQAGADLVNRLDT